MSTSASVAPFPLAGEAASLTAALIWSCSVSVYRHYAAGIPAATVNVFKNCVGSLCMLVALLFTFQGVALSWDSAVLLIISGVVGITCGDTAFFAALPRLGAQVTASIQCMSPPIAAVIATVAFGETLSGREASGMLVTTLAIAGIVWFGRKPGTQLGNMPRRELFIGLGYALASAACQAAGIAMSRFAFRGETDVLVGTLARILPATLLILAVLPVTVGARSLVVFKREPKRALILAIGAFAGTFLGLMLMSFGTKYAKAGVAAALTSTYPVWIIPIAHFGLKERVPWLSAVCTVLAVAGIGVMLWP